MSDHRVSEEVERWLERGGAASRYVRRLLAHPPALFDPAQLAHPLSGEAIRDLLHPAHGAPEDVLQRRLRQVRQTAMLRVIVRDVNGLATLDEVLDTVSALADECIRTAVAELTAAAEQLHGVPRSARTGAAQALVVVAMGKLGGEELNVSSDIDLIFLYPEDGETDGGRPVSNQEFFTR